MTIDELILCRPGTMLIKGCRRRIYMGLEVIGGLRYIKYQVPSRPNLTTMETEERFAKWLAGAETEWEYHGREAMK